MILDAASGVRGVLVGGDGRRIPFAFWADTETGEWKAHVSADGGRTFLRGPDGRRLVAAGRSPGLRLVESAAPAVAAPSAVAHALPHPDELPEKARMFARRCLAVPGRECEERGCHALATWTTADEQELSPQRAAGRLYGRGALTEAHWYCDRHYRPPTVTSPRGVERAGRDARENGA